MADHNFKKSKKSKKKGEDAGGCDARLHKAEDAHALKKLLLKVDDHNAWDMNGDTPLHSYVRRRDKEKFNCLMTFLIHSKCDVNLTNRDGQTALHLACEGDDSKMIKALIAFDAQINRVNNHYLTPLDIVLEKGRHSEVKDLLVQLGGMTAEEMGCDGDEDSFGSGRVSPYTEVDIYSRHLNDGQPLCEDFNHSRPRSLAVVTNSNHGRQVEGGGEGGYGDSDGGCEEEYSDCREFPSHLTQCHGLEGSPTPPPPPLAVAGLSSVPEEEDEQDPVFMTACWQNEEDPVFMTARQHVLLEGSHTKKQDLDIEQRGSTEPNSVDGGSVENGSTIPISIATGIVQGHTPTFSPESSLQMVLTSPKSPTASLEMAITPLSISAIMNSRQQNLLETKQDSLSTIASLSSMLEKTHFLHDEYSSPWLLSTVTGSLPLVGTPQEDSHLTREALMEQAYEEVYSHKGFPFANGVIPQEASDTDSITECTPTYWPLVAHSPTTPSPRLSPAHSPTARSPKCSPAQSPMTKSPALSPMTRSPAHSPMTRSPKVSPRNSRESSPKVSPTPSPTPSPRKLSVVEEEEADGGGGIVTEHRTTHLPKQSPTHSPVTQSPTHSPVTQSPLAKSPMINLPMTKSPMAPSPEMCSPIAQSSKTPSPIGKSPIVQTPLAKSPIAKSPSPMALSPMAPSPIAPSQTHSTKGTADTSSDQPSSQEHDHDHHVHFDEQPAKGGENLPQRYKKHVKRVIFHRQPSSDGPTRSLSMFNNNMDVMTSIIGHGVVHHDLGNLGGQKILCLDGGGVKGLIQIEMLKTIEQMTGKSIAAMFDWVVGTSTGGILALGMIYGGLTLSELRRHYFEMKDTVFKQQSKFISHTCDTNALEELLKRMLGTVKRMDCIEKPNVLITAVEKTTNRLPLVFFNNCFENVENKSVRNEFVWKVARYTSAAPVFFAECDNYVDGGVVANNPTMYALPEIQNFLTQKYGRGSSEARISCVVSLGCGIYPPEPLGNTDIADALRWNKIHRAPQRLGDLLTLLTTALGGSEEMSRLCRINCEHQGISYFRFSPEIGEDVGTTEKDSRKLCEIIIRAKTLFVENAEQVKEMVKVLGCKLQEDYLYHI